MSWRKARGMFRKYTQAPEVPPLEGSTFTDPSIPSRACCCPARPVVVIMPPSAPATPDQVVPVTRATSELVAADGRGVRGWLDGTSAGHGLATAFDTGLSGIRRSPAALAGVSPGCLGAAATGCSSLRESFLVCTERPVGRALPADRRGLMAHVCSPDPDSTASRQLGRGGRACRRPCDSLPVTGRVTKVPGHGAERLSSLPGLAGKLAVAKR
jgi:hypothetical protein